MPLYRLATTLYAKQSKLAAEKIIIHQKVWLKKFLGIPINTSDKTFVLISGDLKVKMEAFATKVREKLFGRLEGKGIVFDPSGLWGPRRVEVSGVRPLPDSTGIRNARPVEALKFFPSNLSSALRAIYSSRCGVHGLTCVTT